MKNGNLSGGAPHGKIVREMATLQGKEDLGILSHLIKKVTLSCSEDPGPHGYSRDIKGLNVWGLLGPDIDSCSEDLLVQGGVPISSRPHLAKKWLEEAVLSLAGHWVALVLTWSTKSPAWIPPHPLPFSSGCVASVLVTPRAG